MKSILISLCLLAASSVQAKELTGRQIIEKSKSLAKPKTGVTEVDMTIVKGGAKQLKVFTLRGVDTDKETGKTLIEFSKPNKIKLLTYSFKAKEDEQWLKMSSGRVKSIASTSRGNYFVGSHFTFEDMRSKPIDNYDYKRLKDVKIGNGVECYQVESVMIKGKKVYSKAINYIRKSDFLPMGSDLYVKGKMLKSVRNYDIKKISGILTPMKVVMKMNGSKDHTTMIVKKVEYNTKVPMSLFNKQSL